MKYLFGLLAWLALAGIAGPAPYPRAVQIRSDDGQTAVVDAGQLLVPENREHPSGRQVTIPWCRSVAGPDR